MSKSQTEDIESSEMPAEEDGLQALHAAVTYQFPRPLDIRKVAGALDHLRRALPADITYHFLTMGRLYGRFYETSEERPAPELSVSEFTCDVHTTGLAGLLHLTFIPEQEHGDSGRFTGFRADTGLYESIRELESENKAFLPQFREITQRLDSYFSSSASNIRRQS